LVHCSSGHKHALQEILSDPMVMTRLSDTKYAQESKTLDRFYELLANDPSRAFYGYNQVYKAAERGGIEVLMVTDGLFRSSDIPTRRKYIDLVEKVKENGGEVMIFSSMHVSGEHLGQLTGVAAILHFAMSDLEDEELDVPLFSLEDENNNEK